MSLLPLEILQKNHIVLLKVELDHCCEFEKDREKTKEQMGKTKKDFNYRMTIPYYKHLSNLR